MIRKTTALAITLALGLIACGDDDTASNNGSKQNNNTNMTNMTNMTSTMATGTMTTGTGTMTTGTGTMATGTMTTGTMTTEPEDKGCDGSAEEPARCKEDPATKTDWAPSSVISELKVLDDASCCQDFNGDGSPDNAIGGLGAMIIGQANTAIQDQINAGNVAIVLEHEGLSDSSTTFDINFLQAEPSVAGSAPNAAGGTPYKVVPSSFAKGAYAKAKIKGATLAGGKVTGGPGNVALTISILGINLSLPLVQAKVEALVDAANTELTSGGKGVALTGGELSGVIGIEALATEINRVSADQCGACLKKNGAAFTGDLFLLTKDEDDQFELSCDMDVSSDDCDETDPIQNVCKSLTSTVCSGAGALPGLADVKLDDLGSLCVDPVSGINNCDAISIATTFSAVGAKIEGVVE